MLNDTYYTIIELFDEEIKRVKASSRLSPRNKKFLEQRLKVLEEAKQDFINSPNKKSSMTIPAAYSIRGKEDEE